MGNLIGFEQLGGSAGQPCQYQGYVIQFGNNSGGLGFTLPMGSFCLCLFGLVIRDPRNFKRYAQVESVFFVLYPSVIGWLVVSCFSHSSQLWKKRDAAWKRGKVRLLMIHSRADQWIIVDAHWLWSWALLRVEVCCANSCALDVCGPLLLEIRAIPRGADRTRQGHWGDTGPGREHRWELDEFLNIGLVCILSFFKNRKNKYL